MQLIMPITIPCSSLTTARTHMFGTMMQRLSIIARKLIKLRQDRREKRSTMSKDIIEPSAPVKLIQPVRSPSVVALGNDYR